LAAVSLVDPCSNALTSLKQWRGLPGGGEAYNSAKPHDQASSPGARYSNARKTSGPHRIPLVLKTPHVGENRTLKQAKSSKKLAVLKKKKKWCSSGYPHLDDGRRLLQTSNSQEAGIPQCPGHILARGEPRRTKRQEKGQLAFCGGGKKKNEKKGPNCSWPSKSLTRIQLIPKAERGKKTPPNKWGKGNAETRKKSSGTSGKATQEGPGTKALSQKKRVQTEQRCGAPKQAKGKKEFESSRSNDCAASLLQWERENQKY